MSTPTGHLLYSWNEKYVSPADVDEHMKVGDAKWEDFPKLLKLVKTNGHFMISGHGKIVANYNDCLLYTSPSPRDVEESRMPSSA